MKIGIGITTRNRPDILNISLDHFNYFKYKEYTYDIFVVDDNSNIEESNKNKNICDKYGVFYKYNNNRLGIAKSKNECIKFTLNYDYVFLFDDDCFPKCHNWEDCYINLYEQTGIEHLLWARPDIEEHLQLSGSKNNINIYSNCMGVLMFFTRNALNILGGLDPRFNLYGYEHAQLSRRADLAGLTNKLGPYVAPYNCYDYIYSMDLDYQWREEEIPLVKQIYREYKYVWKSSICNENREKLIENNRDVWLSDFDIKVDIGVGIEKNY